MGRGWEGNNTTNNDKLNFYFKQSKTAYLYMGQLEIEVITWHKDLYIVQNVINLPHPPSCNFWRV